MHPKPANQSRQIKRHHTPREIVHRVRESLTTRVSKMVCAIFLMFLFVLGLTTFILWLSLRPHRPRFHVQEFSIPGLGQATAFENAQISFNVTIRNPNEHIGIYYDSMDGSVYYKDQKIGSNQLLFPFYQEPKNTTVVADLLSGEALTVNSQRWTEFMNDRAAGMVVFRLEITSIIRFKISRWSSKHHRAHTNCHVSVGPDGVILPTSRDKRCPVYFT
ncbi:NDR1/HIN1-like protein 26 [Juglans microcarpa x Juglans regia]|uniref:NDR1/HIN1-like protein 26 n=1 Tax=Juglans microcarpa x Juglans regia TaxID=2249226 RepID=UPI001B7DB6D1|nr:NDR1/HIN1-like protein 26 [Juglans microcarpa x Juglans regia]